MPEPTTPALPYLHETASQTAGPFVHIGLVPEAAGLAPYTRPFTNVLADERTAGERIRIEGRVLDGTGSPLRDAVVELWQANTAGRYRHPADDASGSRDAAFRGWGRAAADFETGRWWFETVKPGPVPGPGGRPMAPHASLWIVARGINIGLTTRLYFADETSANTADPVLALIEQPSRRQTLLATRHDDAGAVVYRFDVHLQGESETVFFDV